MFTLTSLITWTTAGVDAVDAVDDAVDAVDSVDVGVVTVEVFSVNRTGPVDVEAVDVEAVVSVAC